MRKHKIIQSNLSTKYVTEALRQKRRPQIANGRSKRTIISFLPCKDTGRDSPATQKRADVPKELGELNQRHEFV